ncbi:MAG: DNA helicase RecQ [Prevotellaceae bacterium]|jgi:ATP-dependent DNA helicase RecQ|nr:DNA helicase RecQ [Prevotellaceae bacterium]
MEVIDSKASLNECLKAYFGFNTFIGSQEDIINNVLSGNDTFVLMPTGGGKSLCYQLPALIMEGTAIIISPLIALMKNQVDNMRGFVEENGVAHFLNSSLNKAAILQVKEDVLNGKTKMLYVAPESLTKEENVEFLKQVKISFYAIDEAHCISEWGHDFRPEYRRIRSIVNELGEAPIIALTATATPKVQHDIQKNLGMPEATVFKSSFNRSNLYYEVRPKRDAAKDIIKYIRQRPGKSGIIYCLSRKKVEELAQILSINGIKALPYHAGMDSALRSANQDKFLMEEVDVIVATIAFGMGIDKPDVRFVIHYDIPKSLEGYYQETGRAGRDHGEGQCIAFYSSKDAQKLEKFMQGKPLVEQEIGRQLLLETVSYAESTMCRRRLLLHYFGEEHNVENCGSCDNCLNPHVQFEGKDFVVQLLETVRAVREKCKSDYVIDVLRGENTSVVKLYHYNELDVFGTGADKDDHFWNAVIRQCFINSLLTRDIEQYGILMLTDEGRAFLEHPHTIMLSENRAFCDGDEEDEDDCMGQPMKQTCGIDDELYSMLKGLLTETSKKLEKPPFVIFPEPSLQDMAIQYPVTLEELQNCQGVGAGKAQKFGRPFVDLIRRYVEEKGIDRPQDLVVKSVVNKSANKVYIIKGIDRKMDLHDIAAAKKLNFNELISEIETIVSSGTKLNVDYYINQAIDDDKCADIWDYFAEQATSDSIEDAMSILGSDDYTEEDVRLVRIRFLSEQGN